MRKLVASTSVSRDGVMQAPGGPEEDPTAVFAFGGWAFPYWDEALDPTERGFEGKDREMVLGRKTYEIFEGFRPNLPADNPNAQSMNGARKYVASRWVHLRRPSPASRSSTWTKLSIRLLSRKGNSTPTTRAT